MTTKLWIKTHAGVTACWVVLSLVACGGGGGNSPSPSPAPVQTTDPAASDAQQGGNAGGASSEVLPGGGTGVAAPKPQDPTPPASDANTTLSYLSLKQLSACPQQGMSPVDMSKLSCLTGYAKGLVYDEVAQTYDDKQVCEVWLTAQGQGVIRVNGVVKISHQVSSEAAKFSAGTQKNLLSGSYYAWDRPGSLGVMSLDVNKNDGFMLATAATQQGDIALLYGYSLEATQPNPKIHYCAAAPQP